MLAAPTPPQDPDSDRSGDLTSAGLPAGEIGKCWNAGTMTRRSLRVCARRAGAWAAYSRRGPSVHRVPVAAPDAGMRRSARPEHRIAGQGRPRAPDHLPQPPSPAHSPLRSPARRGLHKCNRNRSAGAGCCLTHPENRPKTGEALTMAQWDAVRSGHPHHQQRPMKVRAGDRSRLLFIDR